MLLGRAIPTVRTKEGVRAKVKDEIITPESVAKYLTQKFGEDFVDVQEAMQALAKAYKPDELVNIAYKMYEKFRPNVPAGEKGWGAKGGLDLGLIRSLAKKAKMANEGTDPTNRFVGLKCEGDGEGWRACCK